jgi:putative transposase
MKYAFVAEHRPTFSVRRMCHCLNIHPSGFYAWIKNPLSHRAREDARQTKLLKEAWNDSGRSMDIANFMMIWSSKER